MRSRRRDAATAASAAPDPSTAVRSRLRIVRLTERRCSFLAGALGGAVVTDTDALGLDAAFPAVLLALVLPSLRDAATRRAALVGTAIALVTSPVLPAGLPVLLALIGVLTALPQWSRPGRALTAPSHEL